MDRLSYMLFAVCILQSPGLLAQNQIGDLMHEVNMNEARNSLGGLRYADIEGSPYYSDQFVEGTVYLKNGATATVPLRYDLYMDEIEYRQEDRIFRVMKTEVGSVLLGREEIIPEDAAYLFVLERGSYSLFVRKKVNFLPRVPPQGYADEAPPMFKRETDVYFLKAGESPALEIGNKKDLIAALGGNEKALGHVRKEKIKPNKAEDLLELVKFLNGQ